MSPEQRGQTSTSVAYARRWHAGARLEEARTAAREATPTRLREQVLRLVRER